MAKISILFLLIISFLIIFSNRVSADISINEIMANPNCSDSICEWIELYNDGTNSVNISGWTISDNNSNDSIESSSGSIDISIPGKSFALIVDDDSRVFHNFNVGENTIWLYVGSDAIGNGLSDNGEKIILYEANNYIRDNITYNSTSGGNTWALINDVWQESNATPGKSNDNNESSSNDYSIIKINEFLPDPNGYDDEDKPNGEFIELYNEGDEDLDLVNFYFKDDSDSHKNFISDTNTLGSTLIESKTYLVIYPRYSSGFLNNEGYERVRLYDFNDNLLDSVSYSNSVEGGSWSRLGNNWYQTIPTPNGANIYNESFLDSTLLIDNVYLGNDEKAKFGDTLRVKVIVYKGNSSKTSISLWIENDKEDISKKTKFNVNEGYTNNTFTVPLQIFPNCNSEFKDGLYDVVIEGLDTVDRYEIKVEGITKSLCGTIEVQQEENKKSIDYDLISSEDEVLIGEPSITTILIRNNDYEDKMYEAWSYVYRGKKSYSGDKEDNKQTIKIPGKSSATLALKNVVNQEGEYNLKVKVKKEDRKTTEDLTKSIKIVGNSIVDTSDNLNIAYENDSVLYTSSGLKAQRSAMLFFNFVLILVIIQLLIRKIL